MTQSVSETSEVEIKVRRSLSFFLRVVSHHSALMSRGAKKAAADSGELRTAGETSLCCIVYNMKDRQIYFLIFISNFYVKYCNIPTWYWDWDRQIHSSDFMLSNLYFNLYQLSCYTTIVYVISVQCRKPNCTSKVDDRLTTPSPTLHCTELHCCCRHRP